MRFNSPARRNDAGQRSEIPGEGTFDRVGLRVRGEFALIERTELRLRGKAPVEAGFHQRGVARDRDAGNRERRPRALECQGRKPESHRRRRAATAACRAGPAPCRWPAAPRWPRARRGRNSRCSRWRLNPTAPQRRHSRGTNHRARARKPARRAAPPRHCRRPCRSRPRRTPVRHCRESAHSSYR